ncbi:hypothetical protein [Paenibacillus sp. PvR148]
MQPDSGLVTVNGMPVKGPSKSRGVVYSMEFNDNYLNDSNGEAVGNYLKSVGKIKEPQDPKSYHALSLLKEVAPELLKAELK